MDKNMMAGIYLLLLPAVFYIIEKSTSKRDGRFKLGYNPMSMSWKGWLFSILWLVIWLFGAYKLTR